jgi:hypothetical protein
MDWTAKQWWFTYQHEQEIIFFSKAPTPATGPNKFPIQGIIRTFPQQQSGQDVWPSSFSTKVKNERSFTSTPTYAFNGMQ